MRVIAICGFKRTGKDTVANYIANKYNYHKCRIAEPLKQICKYLFDLRDEQMEDDEKELVDERWGVSPRKIMQFFGTEIMQKEIQKVIPSIDRNFWINKFIHQQQSHCKPIVISDLRFMHEYNALYKEYGDKLIVIKILKQQYDRVNDTHVSETEWENIPATYEIENNSTLEVLYKKVDNFFS